MKHPLKLVICYDMQPGKEEACQRYVMQTLGPTLDRFGFRFLDAWYTVWGNGPQMMGYGLLDDIETARKLLTSEAWREVADGMKRYATSFSVRLIEPAAAFQI